MNRKELTEKIAEATGESTYKVEKVLDALFDSIEIALIGGEDVSIRHFGTFTTKNVDKKKGRDFKTGEMIDIPEKRVPFLRFAKDIKEWCNK